MRQVDLLATHSFRRKKNPLCAYMSRCLYESNEDHATARENIPRVSKRVFSDDRRPKLALHYIAPEKANCLFWILLKMGQQTFYFNFAHNFNHFHTNLIATVHFYSVIAYNFVQIHLIFITSLLL